MAYSNPWRGTRNDCVIQASSPRVMSILCPAQGRMTRPRLPCTGARAQRIIGNPDADHISTSNAERAHLIMRMHMRRFTRLTNPFPTKVNNHKAAIALHFVHYNFARTHKTFRVTPVMEAGATNHVWSLEEIAALAR